MQTWEDGISGTPSLAKLEKQALAAKQEQEQLEKRMNSEGKTKDDQPTQRINTADSQPLFPDMGDNNAVRNLHLIRQDAAKILDQAKEQTGIYTTDDLKALATEMMKLGTECLREFMAGYREGRDREMDKMLNEYFREELNPGVQPQDIQEQAKRQQSDEGHSHDNNESTGRPPRKRRRPKRGIPRD
jgi:hypothetical protein